MHIDRREDICVKGWVKSFEDIKRQVFQRDVCGKAMGNKFYTLAKNINENAQLNRAMLVKVMTEVGFVNYPTEWWHWSFGDKYWAFMTNAPAAIFSIPVCGGH